MQMRKLVPAVLVATAFAFVLTGCTETGPTQNFSGLPDEEEIATESEGGADQGLQAFWLQEGSQIAVAISGSSSCPVVGSRIDVVEPENEGNVVEITTRPISSGPCTMDFVPHTSVFWTPDDVTTAEPLTVRVGDQEIELPIK
ncbi:hypothetical protein ITJ64_02100 [Herbiconiux sp. VKM Ac-1786]|jgi:hypothetical protein|uniref:hypothetical protein n=1 Tax=Herbiconiux sp. VKM Ac-1786 TaxID=2783824 RepID=UPI00188DA280|nr:hypothetical protein [Herbiconiux sp. VKM Ac-1786]MBF4571299.1 hypothetical protein [Herbiconiux sp. VKM Ac-1786]